MRTREIIICLFFILIAIVRFFFFIPKPPAGYFDAVDKQVVFEGMVSEGPDVRIKNQRLTVNLKGTNTNILVVAQKEIPVSYGDMLKVSGKLELPENFMTNAGKEFNYQRYLSNKNVYFITQNASVEIVSHDNGSFIKKYLFKLSDAFMKNISSVIPAPESDLANGLLLGSKGGFDTDTKNEFVNTGTIHIIALSGYNISIVARAVMSITSLFLGIMASSIAGIFIIILFVIMSGAGASAIRAGIMAVISLFGRITGRTYNAGRALVVAGLIMFAYDPRVITDISFQLSFLATFGILFITPKVINWIMWIPARFGLREIAATTIAAEISVLPLLIYSTGILSFVAFPANILILAFIPLTMLLTFIAGMMVFISPVFAMPFGYISYLPLTYILRTIHFFASLPFASVTIQSFPLIITLALYALILWWIFKKEETILPY